MSARLDADPQIGRTLGGQYRIEALLGYGGMGRVYRGLQLSVKRPVAIKLIAGQAPYPSEWVQRFRREAEATASLSHPNSVRLFDFGVTESEELYMVMELLDGSDLAHQLQASGALPLTAALSIARQVLLALCEAHALGITHRDIKPDNIFLANVRGADVVAKVMDFGIAGLAQAHRNSRLTGTGVIIGTPLYMSPEQAQGLPVNGKSDVYSLGVVLFEMLTGRPVFESNTAVNLLLAHVAKPPMRLQDSGVKLREEASLQALLDRLLAKDPAQRPSAADALESITALSARLGIASATGAMRAVSMPTALAESPAAKTPAPGLALSKQDMIEHGFASRSASADDPSLRDFQAVRATSAPTRSAARPTIFLLGAGLVLTAATALALRWVPALVDAAQPTAAAPKTLETATRTSEPEERTVLIRSQPSGAQVFVAGAKVGTTPFELKLRADTEISLAHEGYRRKLVNVAYDTRTPVAVKLQAEDKHPAPSSPSDVAAAGAIKLQAEDKHPALSGASEGPAIRLRAEDERAPRAGASDVAAADTKRAPLVFSFGQETAPSVRPRRETTADKARLRAPPDTADRSDREGEAAPQEQGLVPEPPERHGQRADDIAPAPGNLYGPEPRDDPRGAEIQAEHAQPSAAETSRSAASSAEPIQEEELSDVALDSEEQAHVKENYGLRAVGRAVARAFGRLLIPYPSRARRAALADMPLAYPSFREARNAYKHREIDATAFEEAVWQLRERRRQQISKEHELYARGQITQSQYEAHMDRIWDEFWGQRR